MNAILAALAEDGAPIIVTGGGGWLGRATLDLLEDALGPDLPARVLVYGSHARDLPLRRGEIRCRALAELDDYAGPPPLLLHYACLTKDRVAGMGEDAFMSGNAAIRDRVLRLVRRRGVRGLFLPSSGAAHGEDPYGRCKRLDEAAFADVAPAVIARVFNLAGPFINKPEAYALASFILALIEDRPIEIRARGRVLRSYLHVTDLLLLALGALLRRQSARFETEGEVAVELEELARRCAALLGRPDAPITRAAPDGRPDDRYIGDGSAMRTLAASLGLTLRHLDAQILDTARYLSAAAAAATRPG